MVVVSSFLQAMKWVEIRAGDFHSGIEV